MLFVNLRAIIYHILEYISKTGCCDGWIYAGKAVGNQVSMLSGLPGISAANDEGK
jgi:hypothetical protein